MEKKVILIQGQGYEWYEQAIFIVNRGKDTAQVDFVREAENIIEAYQKGRKPAVMSEVKHGAATVHKAPKRKKAGDFILNIAIVCCVLVLVLLLGNAVI